MTFAKAASARLVLRALAGEKTASMMGAIGGMARGVGRAANSVWQSSMKHNGPVMGTIAAGLAVPATYALGSHAINRTKATYQGFDPNVQAYTRQTPY